MIRIFISKLICEKNIIAPIRTEYQLLVLLLRSIYIDNYFLDYDDNEAGECLVNTAGIFKC